MSKKRWRMPARIKVALDETGLPWTAEHGGRHVHIRIAGELVCVVNSAPMDESPGRALNVIAAIKRAGRASKVA